METRDIELGKEEKPEILSKEETSESSKSDFEKAIDEVIEGENKEETIQPPIESPVEETTEEIPEDEILASKKEFSCRELIELVDGAMTHQRDESIKEIEEYNKIIEAIKSAFIAG